MFFFKFVLVGSQVDLITKFCITCEEVLKSICLVDVCNKKKI